ncbi:MAG: hypothetical protein AAGD22_12925 [Verrucomicrobiota bacterium]
MKTLFVVSLVIGISVVGAPAGPDGEWRVEDGVEAFHFETPELSGVIVGRDERDLGKGYGKHGVRGLVHVPTGSDLSAPEGPVGAKRRHQGMVNLYRVYGEGETFGSLRDDQAEVERLTDGLRLNWRSTEERPVEVTASWRVTGPGQIDVEMVAMPERAIENFEILPATYVDVLMEKGMYAEGEGEGEVTILRQMDTPGERPQYPFFPLGEDARAMQEKSGRMGSSWIWPSYVHAGVAALPIIFAESEDVEIVLMGDPEAVSAVCVTPKPEAGEPEEWNSVGQHSALYFSLFGRDVEAGEECRARMRLVVLPAGGDGDEGLEGRHRELYEDFLGS